MSLKAFGETKQVSASVTRPANVTAYTQGDVIDLAVGAGFTFSAVVRGNGMAGAIVDATLISSANVSPAIDAILFLFTVALGAYDNDNATFTPSDAELLTCIGAVEFKVGDEMPATIAADAAGNAITMASHDFLPLGFVCASAVDGLFGVLTANNAYVPVSAEVITIILKVAQGS